MKRFSFLFLLVVLGAAGIAIPTSAQTFADASLTLERAVHAEMVSGDMDRAISLYRQVAESISASREDMAKALIALGRSYELTGSDEAVTVYNRLVSEFPDQPDAFLSAHDALARLAPSLKTGAAPTAEQDYTLLLDGATFGAGNGVGRHHDISPDGSTIVFGAETLPYRKALYPDLENELYFVESGSVMRPVIEDAEDWVGVHMNRWLPRWSPDGKHLLFRARMRTGGNEAILARRDLAAAKTVLLPAVNVDPQCGPCQDMTWLADSQGFIKMSRGSFELYSLDGALIRRFDTDGVATRLGGVSPDGQFLVYLKQNKEATGYTFNFNIWLLDLQSGEHTQVTRDDGFKGVPTWTRDSRAVYYTGPTLNQGHLYKKEIGSEAEAEQVTFYQNASVRHPVVLAGTGELTFALVSGSSTVLVAPAASPERAREILAGYAPIAASDGRTLYFWDVADGSRGLWSAALDGGGRKHLVRVDGNEVLAGGASLSPDGSQFAYFVSTAEGSVLYTVPSSGGTPRRLHVAKEAYGGAPGWSPDGKELAFSDGPDLMVMAASGGGAQSIARAQRWQGGEISWSPDGKYIAGFAYFEEGSSNNILQAVNRQTREVTQLSPADELKYKETLSWHPDGERISYIMSAGGPSGKYVTRTASLSGGPVETLFDGAENFESYWGVWGPDGRYYFMETRGAGIELFVNGDDGNEARLFIQPKHNGVIWPLPSWSSDGSVITWSEQSSNTQIWSLTDRK